MICGRVNDSILQKKRLVKRLLLFILFAFFTNLLHENINFTAMGFQIYKNIAVLR